jgi:HlyD family secretion protein
MGGRVIFLGCREGDSVQAGALLLRLDDSELRASFDLSKRSWQASQASMREACVAAELAARELQRNQALNQQGIVSDAILDQLSNRNDAAKARCEAARAEVERAEASVKMVKANLKRTELRAPFSGVIAQLTTEVGEWITPSPPGVPIPPVIDLLDDESIYVEAPMDETDAGKLKVGLPVRISLEPYPDRSFGGKVTRVAPFVQDIEGQNRTVSVEVEIDDKDSVKMLPGTSADMEVILQSRENVLRIPTYALMEGGEVLQIEENRLMARAVKTGLRNWEFVEIREGLKAGDQIAVSLDRAEVKEGALVRVQEEVGR